MYYKTYIFWWKPIHWIKKLNNVILNTSIHPPIYLHPPICGWVAKEICSGVKLNMLLLNDLQGLLGNPKVFPWLERIYSFCSEFGVCFRVSSQWGVPGKPPNGGSQEASQSHLTSDEEEQLYCSRVGSHLSGQNPHLISEAAQMEQCSDPSIYHLLTTSQWDTKHYQLQNKSPFVLFWDTLCPEWLDLHQHRGQMIVQIE